MDETLFYVLTCALTVTSAMLGFFLRRIPEELRSVSRAVSELATEVARIYVMLEEGERRMERLEMRTQRHTEKIDRLEVAVSRRHGDE